MEKDGWKIYANRYFLNAGLYTDESPGLKVDPVIVLVLSLGFIFSVVALHSKYIPFTAMPPLLGRYSLGDSYR